MALVLRGLPWEVSQPRPHSRKATWGLSSKPSASKSPLLVLHGHTTLGTESRELGFWFWVPVLPLTV